MSIVTPRDLTTERLVLQTGTEMVEIYNPTTGQNEKIQVNNLFKGVGGGETFYNSGYTCTEPRITYWKVTDNTIRLGVDWGSIPKSGASISMTYFSMKITDNHNTYVFDGTETFGAIAQSGTQVVIPVTKTSAFTLLSETGSIVSASLLITIL